MRKARCKAIKAALRTALGRAAYPDEYRRAKRAYNRGEDPVEVVLTRRHVVQPRKLSARNIRNMIFGGGVGGHRA